MFHSRALAKLGMNQNGVSDNAQGVLVEKPTTASLSFILKRQISGHGLRAKPIALCDV
jgi:hypothetical protein